VGSSLAVEDQAAITCAGMTFTAEEHRTARSALASFADFLAEPPVTDSFCLPGAISLELTDQCQTAVARIRLLMTKAVSSAAH
jgi:hypothetical protein